MTCESTWHAICHRKSCPRITSLPFAFSVCSTDLLVLHRHLSFFQTKTDHLLSLKKVEHAHTPRTPQRPPFTPPP